MGWQDPSPRARVRSPAGNPAAQPGYRGERVSSGRLPFRLALALAVAAALVVAALAWTYLANRLAAHGLSARVRDGNAGWRLGPDSGTADALIVADAVTDLAGAVADIAGDVIADL